MKRAGKLLGIALSSMLLLTGCKERPTHILTLIVEGEGEVTGAGKREADMYAGITATPSEGYIFSAWMEDEKLLSRNSSWGVTMDKDHELTAVFVEGKELVLEKGGIVRAVGPYAKVTKSDGYVHVRAIKEFNGSEYRVEGHWVDEEGKFDKRDFLGIDLSEKSIPSDKIKEYRYIPSSTGVGETHVLLMTMEQHMNYAGRVMNREDFQTFPRRRLVGQCQVESSRVVNGETINNRMCDFSSYSSNDYVLVLAWSLDSNGMEYYIDSTYNEIYFNYVGQIYANSAYHKIKVNIGGAVFGEWY